MKKLFLIAAFAFAGATSFAAAAKTKTAQRQTKKPNFIVHTSCGIDVYLNYTPGMLGTCLANDGACGTHMVLEYLNCPC